MFRIGIISDTHNHLDARLPQLFQGVDHILHGGDVGLPWLIAELERIAPVTAVLGNTDSGIRLKETEAVQLAGKKFLVHHIVEARNLSEALQRRMDEEQPDVVVFGHTHRPCCATQGQTLYLNPGYAGKPRFNLPRSVAILSCDDGHLAARFIDL
ncbi:MAG: metallophosphoesterase family protein [Verrucomicrobia bacterium]|nr:metallophosphoesterase family protein [Verrucomicrobiota bacterium]